jgi:hypothetical protein
LEQGVHACSFHVWNAAQTPEVSVRQKLERAKFHMVCHAVPDVAKAIAVPISYDYPSSSATDEYFCVSVDLTLALQLLRDVLCVASDEWVGTALVSLLLIKGFVLKVNFAGLVALMCTSWMTCRCASCTSSVAWHLGPCIVG